MFSESSCFENQIPCSLNENFFPLIEFFKTDLRLYHLYKTFLCCKFNFFKKFYSLSVFFKILTSNHLVRQILTNLFSLKLL